MPPHDATNGDLAAKLGVELALPPDEDQRDILDAIYAYSNDAPTIPTCSTVTAVAPRQNIKTSTLEVAALTDLVVFQEPLHVWTAHLTKTSRKTFEHMCFLIDSNPELKSLFRPHRTANGSEAIELWSGERIEFYARSKGAGRGITARKITMDEALFLEPADMGALGPTMVTIPDAQIRYGSSAGLAQSAVLRDLRDRGRLGNDSRFAYFEWCAPRRDCERPDCPHKPVDEIPGCALDDRALWRAANVAYGRRITEAALLEQRKLLPPEEFMREFLGWWEDPAAGEVAIPPARWLRNGDRISGIVGTPSLAVSMSPDRLTVALLAAGRRSDGQMSVEVVAHGATGPWFAAKVRDVAARHGAEVAIHPGHQAGTLIPELQGLSLRALSTTDYVQACGVFYDLAMAGTLRYPEPQPELTDAVGRGSRKFSGETWRWIGEGITALVAGSIAVWAAANPSQGGWAVSV